MAGPHSEPSSIGMFVDDTIFVDELANKSPAELQAIGLNKLRTRCLQAVLKANKMNANTFYVVFTILPRTFKCCANPDVHLVDVAVEKLFNYVSEKTTHNKSASLDAAIVHVNALSSATRSFGNFIDQTNWLHCNYGPEHDVNNRLVRLLRCITSLYAYCCNWAYTDKLYTPYGQTSVVPLTDEATEAFRWLYEQSKRLQELVLRYVLSADFAREVAKKPKESKLRGVLCDVFSGLRTILQQTAQFDIRGSADVWKCIVKLCTNNASLLAQSEMDQIQWLLLNLCGTIRDMDYDDSDCFERNIKVALFHAKIMLRLYQLIAPKMPRCHFERYAELLLLLKEKFSSADNDHSQALLGVMQDILPILYSRGMGDISDKSDKMLRLDLYMNILTLLLNETSQEIVEEYAQKAFLLDAFAKILQKIAIVNTSTIDYYRPVVVRITALIVLVSQRFPNLIVIVDKALCNALHSNEYLQCMLAFDVWQLRCTFLSPDQCLQYLITFWSRRTGNSVFCYRAESVFSRALLCSFYDSLPLDCQNRFVDELTEENNYDIVPSSPTTSKKMQQVLHVLGVQRITDPAKRFQITANSVDTFTMSVQKFEDEQMDYHLPKRFYALQIARHGLRGVQMPSVALAELCDQMHPTLPVYFSVELDHLLGQVDSLTNEQVLLVLNALTAHFVKRSNERDVDQHPDTLIRLQTTDWLCHAAQRHVSLSTESGRKFVRIVAELLGQLLHSPTDDSRCTMIQFDAFVQANCMRRFVEVGPLMRQESIIGKTLQHSDRLKLDVARVLRKERLAELPAAIVDAELVSLSEVRYRHVCKGRFNNLTVQTMDESFNDLAKIILDIDRWYNNGLLTEHHWTLLRRVKGQINVIR